MTFAGLLGKGLLVAAPSRTIFDQVRVMSLGLLGQRGGVRCNLERAWTRDALVLCL